MGTGRSLASRGGLTSLDLFTDRMTSSVNMLKAKSSRSRLVEPIEHGHERESFIARNERQAAKLVPINSALVGNEQVSRRVGSRSRTAPTPTMMTSPIYYRVCKDLEHPT